MFCLTAFLRVQLLCTTTWTSGELKCFIIRYVIKKVFWMEKLVRKKFSFKNIFCIEEFVGKNFCYKNNFCMKNFDTYLFVGRLLPIFLSKESERISNITDQAYQVTLCTIFCKIFIKFCNYVSLTAAEIICYIYFNIVQFLVVLNAVNYLFYMLQL